MRYLKLWALLAVVILGSFAVLGYYAAVLLPAVGRRGRAPRPPLMRATPIGAWRLLGFIGEQDEN